MGFYFFLESSRIKNDSYEKIKTPVSWFIPTLHVFCRDCMGKYQKLSIIRLYYKNEERIGACSFHTFSCIFVPCFWIYIIGDGEYEDDWKKETRESKYNQRWIVLTFSNILFCLHWIVKGIEFWSDLYWFLSSLIYFVHTLTFWKF